MDSCRLAWPPLSAASHVLLVSILGQTIAFLFKESLDQEHSGAINLPDFTSALSKSKGDIFKHLEGRSSQTIYNPPSEWSDIKHEMRSEAVNAVSQEEGKRKTKNKTLKHSWARTVTVAFNFRAYEKAAIALISIYSFI